MATAVLPAPTGQNQISRGKKESAPRRLKQATLDDGVTFEKFYDTYCTNLKKAEQDRETYKKKATKWDGPGDDDFDAAEKGLLIMDDSDPNVFVRCRRLRQFARWTMEQVKDPEDKVYISKALTTELKSVSVDEDAELTIPPKIAEEVIKYANDEGQLTEDFYELRGDDWVKLDKKPNMEQDFRERQSDEAHTENRSGHLHIIPDFVETICNDAEHTSLFRKMLADPLDKKTADEYAKTVNPKIKKEAKKQKFEGEDPTLPVSQVRDIVMSCAHLHHAISKLEVMPNKGAGLRDEDGKPLPDYNAIFNTWTNTFNDMMDNKGYPPSWKGYLLEAIPTLASRRGVDQPFTSEEIQEVSSQHGKSRTKCNMEELFKGREQASKVLAIKGAVSVEDKESSMAVDQDTSAVLGKRKTPSGLPGRQVKRIEAAMDEPSANSQANMPALDADTPMSEAETSNIHQANPAPHDQDISMAEVGSTQHDTSSNANSREVKGLGVVKVK